MKIDQFALEQTDKLTSLFRSQIRNNFGLKNEGGEVGGRDDALSHN